MKAGTYYIGDLCYCMHEEWGEVCSLIFNRQSGKEQWGEFTLEDGRYIAVLPTAHGVMGPTETSMAISTVWMLVLLGVFGLRILIPVRIVPIGGSWELSIPLQRTLRSRIFGVSSISVIFRLILALGGTVTNHQFQCLTELIKWMGFFIMFHLVPDPTLKMVIAALGLHHGLTYLYLMYFKKVDESVTER